MSQAQVTTKPVGTVERFCPLCSADNKSLPVSRYSVPDWHLKSCPQCGFVYIENAPLYDALATDMAWEKRAAGEEQRRSREWGNLYKFSKKSRWRLHIFPRKKFAELLARHATPGNVIDLGCGYGDTTMAGDDTFVPHGIEVSTEMCRHADALFRQHGGYAVHAPCLEGLKQFPDQYFTAATLRSYLEHELEPAAVLRETRRILKPGGVAIVKVPNYGSLNRRLRGQEWCGFRFPDHLNYFTPSTLRDMGEAAGFRVTFSLTWKLPTSDNMYALMTRP